MAIAKGCSFVRRNAECLDAALSWGYIGHIPQTPKGYCYYKLVTNINRTVNKYFCIISAVYCLICFSQTASRTQTALAASSIIHPARRHVARLG